MTLSALTGVGALLADRTRSSMLTVLMDGRARTGGELARQVGVAPSTASEHLSRLLDARFVAVEAQGRHRYFRLAGPEIAELLESLGGMDAPDPAHGPSPRAASDLRYARSCYDHLAGQLGVQVYDHLLESGHLHTGEHLTLTASGRARLRDLGVDTEASGTARRPLVRSCLDWTERRHHLAGAAGAALLEAMLARRWLVRGGRPRSLRVTESGQRGLAAFLDSA